jgi:hypothetical protein
MENKLPDPHNFHNSGKFLLEQILLRSPYNCVKIVSVCSTTKGNGGVTNKKNVK